MESLQTAPWLWPLSPPSRLRTLAWDLAGAADCWSRGLRGMASAAAVGTLPVLLSIALSVPGHQIVSALLLSLLCLSCVRRDAGFQAVGLALTAFVVHGAVVMVLVHAWPDRMSRLLPGAAEYWHKQLGWIRTGWDPEYETAAWLPAHLGQLGGAVVYSYASLGWITFAEGFREVDWMNFYCVQLMKTSRSAALAGLLGWHVWSLVRGVGLAFVTVEILSLSLGRLTGRDLSTPPARRRRWAAGLGLLALDGILKALLLCPVQAALLAHLR